MAFDFAPRTRAARIAAPRGALLLLALAGALVFAPGLRAEDAGPPAATESAELQATRPALEDEGDHARLTMELTGEIEPSAFVTAAFVLADPDRVIIDAPQLRFMMDPEIGKAAAEPPQAGKRHRHRHAKSSAPAERLVRPAGLIGSFRFGRLDKGRSRIVIDLNAPVRIVRAACETSEDGKPRLVIELARTERARFVAAAQTARLALAKPAEGRIARKIEAAGGKPVVMIDPGHGGIDRGATVNGLIEKDLVLDFAKALAAKLDADGRYQPVLTREDDVFVALGERVRMAQDRKVALFVSIHADTLAESADVSGATVYTVSDRASDAEAARYAEKENQADAAAGVERAEDASDVSDILFDLTRRETRAYSHVFARTLLNYWKFAGRLNKNPQRAAGFRVLKAPDVPSVLLELGYLSSAKDDAALSSPQWREKAVARMSEAIAAFFGERGEGSGVPANAGEDPAPVGSLAAAPSALPAAVEGESASSATTGAARR
ncbi:N-acetylmuramoyl-L-alanine amidase [Methylocella silvestris BL2]|uniref:N-acetylmuramoyl-L-alanine amidase n=1 Tax=Methylocella silvestris (strain DSM 15510 / CIP 108128 / LMG 27833 / NCIMB 13906 / BL2) TaxID=395965 RepID=B8EPB1_METSB|nr:N-acetylmuramoyl-L-alanine amidase [Methylocella silvestris]ACK49699.1 N-acetylmuramoyl-L-alanine amidase [Methylocella silvestris BL2]